MQEAGHDGADLLPRSDLRERYAEGCGEGTQSRHKRWLVRRIVWRMQALKAGDLSERARQRAKEIESDADVRVIPPNAKTELVPVHPPGLRSLLPGSVLVRPYKLCRLEVQVLEAGFEFEGEWFATLSVVAK